MGAMSLIFMPRTIDEKIPVGTLPVNLVSNCFADKPGSLYKKKTYFVFTSQQGRMDKAINPTI
jgi:hypothetical protein